MTRNGIYVKDKTNVVAATNLYACHICALKYHKDHPEKSLTQCYNAVRGKTDSKYMKVFPSIHDADGNKIYVCSHCAKLISDELAKAEEEYKNKNDEKG